MTGKAPSFSELRVTTFGEAKLVGAADAGPPATILASSKPLALLVYLHCSPTHSARKEQLIELLWADLPPDSARHALRQAVWYTRQRLGSETLATTAAGLTLTETLSSDWADFWQALEAGNTETAVDLYRGEFLAGFAMPGAAEFEDWLHIERHRLRRAFVGAVETVVRDNLAAGENRQARDLARRAHSVEPEQQALHRLVLETLLAAGDRLSAIAEAEALENTLREQTREPDLATNRLLSLVRKELQVVRQSSSDENQVVGTLWAELVGREKEFGEILGAWNKAKSGQAVHLHVSGMAGLGKTRLLDDVATRLRSTGATVIHIGAKVANRGVEYTFASALVECLSHLPGAPGVSPDGATALVALNPVLSSRFPVKPDRAVGAEALRRRTIAVVEMLAAVADEKPLVVLLDDFHWADKVSRNLIHSACSSTELRHILCVSAARPSPEVESCTEGVRKLILEPLTRSHVEAIVVCLGTLPTEVWAGELAARLFDCTGGSPLLVLETLHLALDRGLLELTGEGWKCRDSSTLWTEFAAGGALLNRIRQLNPEEAGVLLLLAVAGAPLSRTQLEQLTALGFKDPFRPLDSLLQRGLVNRSGDHWNPAHDEIAAIAIEIASPETQRAAHSTVGRVLSAQGKADGRLLTLAARHLALAGETAELQSAFLHLVDLARRTGDARTAAELAAEVLGDSEKPETVETLVRSLPLAKRLTRSTKRLAAVAVLTVAAACLALVFALLGPPQQQPDAEFLLMGPSAGNGFTVRSLPFDIEGWDPRRPIEASASHRTFDLPIETQRLGAVPARQRTGGPWLLPYVFPDSGGEEIVLLSSDGSLQRLTFSPGDDTPFDWSPDGRFIVFQTARWNADSYYDLAILDVETKSVRPLIRGDSVYDNPAWSPDGTRIAYIAKRVGTTINRPCWITVDGLSGTCRPELGEASLSVVGWYDPTTLVILTVTPAEKMLGLWNLNTDAIDTLEGDYSGLYDVSISPEGTWLVIRRVDGNSGEILTSVIPFGHPELSRRVSSLGDDKTDVRLGWFKRPDATPYLNSITLPAPTAGVPLSAPHRFTVAGFDARGEPLDPPYLNFETSDSTVATIDQHGVLTPRSTGETAVSVSAGGWRSDSAIVSVVEPRSTTVLTEAWSDNYMTRWRPYGVPKPFLTSKDGIRALVANGDGPYSSGVYSVAAWDTNDGLGIEVEISSPTAGIVRQNVLVEMVPLDSATMSTWDHATGFYPGRNDRSSICAFRYPTSDNLNSRGIDAATLGVGTSHTLNVPPDLHTGRWYTLTMQIFPDRTCGVAIDGVPLARSAGRLPSDRPMHVMLYATSRDINILHGPLEVWTGVKGDVDWRLLQVSDSAR